ncbi:hypothetical protein GQ53DRAFT_781936 [Thozetella sp. PMI_491]|nr:hypothetical protein GQ53DRAFT_781936 [Thozetella sp. PMI_491]
MFGYHQQPKRFKKSARVAAIFTFLLFEKIFVISLPSRTDRRDAILLSAALSNIEIEFIDAVQGNEVPDKSMIKTWDYPRLQDGEIGCWRSHVNAMHEIVRRNISSALIIEDDADWDIRLKDQLTGFALSVHALIQPLLKPDPTLYADPTYPKPTNDSPGKVPDILFEDLPITVPPIFSPYGDNWDVLWIGHSAMLFPSESSTIIPKGRVIRKNDDTVAGKEQLRSLKEPFEFKEIYPDHTRAVHHPQGVWGTVGYGVSQQGARTILSEVGLRDVYKPIDWLLSYYCEGTEGHAPHNCLTTQPPLFINHRAVGHGSSSSDIRNDNIKYRLEGESDMIRWSTWSDAFST